MTSALRWAAKRAIISEGQSHKTVSTDLSQYCSLKGYFHPDKFVERVSCGGRGGGWGGGGGLLFRPSKFRKLVCQYSPLLCEYVKPVLNWANVSSRT